MYISWAYVNGQGHEETTLENMLYAYFSLIFERISLKLGWYIGSISFYKLWIFSLFAKCQCHSETK